MKDTDENLSMRIGRTDPLLRPFIWQQILVQALFQILVMSILMFFGGLMLGFDQAPNIVYDKLRDPAGNATNRLVMDTFIFHVFVLMNLFNSINCRVLNLSELNMFSTIIDNWIFLAVLAAEFFLQQCMVNSGSMTLSVSSALLGTAELSTTMNIVAYVLGALVLPVGVLAKKIPAEKFAFTKAWTLEDKLDMKEKAKAKWVELRTKAAKKPVEAEAPEEAAE